MYPCSSSRAVIFAVEDFVTFKYLETSVDLTDEPPLLSSYMASKYLFDSVSHNFPSR